MARFLLGNVIVNKVTIVNFSFLLFFLFIVSTLARGRDPERKRRAVNSKASSGDVVVGQKPAPSQDDALDLFKGFVLVIWYSGHTSSHSEQSRQALLHLWYCESGRVGVARTKPLNVNQKSHRLGDGIFDLEIIYSVIQS